MHVRLFFIVFLIMMLILPSAKADDNSVKVGLLENMFQDIPRPILEAMSEPFRSLMTKQTGLTGDVEICKDYKILLGKLKDKSLNIGVFHGFEFAWAHQAEPNLIPLVITIPHGRKAQSMILVQKDSDMKKLSDLGNSKIIRAKGTKAFTSVYMEKLKQTVQGIQFQEGELTMTPEEALTAVATGTEKAVIIDASSLSGYSTLQPGGFKQLRILAESELFPCSVIAMVKDSTSEAAAAKIINGMSTANKTAQGRAMLAMWSLKGFEKVPADYQQQCKNILSAYPVPKEAGK